MSACTISCFHSGLPHPEGKCAACPDRLRTAAEDEMKNHDEETTGSTTLDTLINVAMAHECPSGAEVARWQAIATRAVEALRRLAEWGYKFHDCGEIVADELFVADSCIAEFDAAGGTTALDEMLLKAVERARRRVDHRSRTTVLPGHERRQASAVGEGPNRREGCGAREGDAVTDYKKCPFRADFMGGYVFSGDLMFAQVRGWGYLQRHRDAEKTQDEHLQFMVDALNEKAERDAHPLMTVELALP